MIPFLKQIARCFVGQQDLKLENLCFVFPNRRSCAFFKKYLAEEKHGFIFPEIITISDFITRQSGLIEAGRVEQLFALFGEYRKLQLSRKEQHVVEFDNFLYWGDMILSDFNDIDRYLINPKEIFVNVKDYKAINSNYLTKEQVEVINDFFGEYRNYSSESSLWQSESKKRFFKLWEDLEPLYEAFCSNLRSRGMAYSGMAYRMAAEKVSKATKDDFPFDRIIFVGFSTLSKAEEDIFDSLQRIGLGDYYWDFNSPVFSDSENKGTFFLRDYVKRYPSRFDIGEEPIKELPNINIISVPSGGGQAKVAGRILRDLVKNGEIGDTDNAIDTAIVLPEEKYLNSVLFSIPDEIGRLNITMGYPMANTSVAVFMDLLATLHSKKRVINGNVSYFYDDLESFLSHPYVKNICGDEALRLQKEVIDKRLFFVPKDVINKFMPSLDVIFPQDDFGEPHDVVDYVMSVVDFISNRLGDTTSSEMKLEQYFIRQYLNVVSQLGAAVDEYGLAEMSERTFFFLIDRMISGAIVAFEGEPMCGLQVMGVLETRLLDFKNIIIFSMNEKIFPTKHYTRSFIPTSIRKGYGISTYRNQDSMFTYYFYRMISRAENVFLLYDSRVQGISSGEVSRYIYQLRQLYNRGNCNESIYSYNITLPDEQALVVEKDVDVMSKLDEFRKRDSGKSFSASMINDYVACPLKFYFKHVELIPEDDEIKDFIDSATFGTIVHEIMQRIYDTVPLDSSNRRVVDSGFFDNWLKNGSIDLLRLSTIVINKEYNKIGDNNLSPLTNDAKIIREVMLYYIRPLLEHDKALAPFEYLESEMKEGFYWQLGDGVAINFKYIIDRMDIVAGIRRIVDYKTGSDKTDIKNLDYIFNNPNRNEAHMKAVLQLLLYCNAYTANNGFDDAIQPVIYNIRSVRMLGGKQFCLKFDKDVVLDYRDKLNDGFMEKIREIIKEIYDSRIPFRQTSDLSQCAFCPYSEACGRV